MEESKAGDQGKKSKGRHKWRKPGEESNSKTKGGEREERKCAVLCGVENDRSVGHGFVYGCARVWASQSHTFSIRHSRCA